MNEIVNSITRIQTDIRGSGVTLRTEDGFAYLTGPAGPSSLRLVRLYRPSSDDIEREAAPDVLLVLTSASSKAVQSAARHNHIFLPSGGYRIVAPGVALINAESTVLEDVSRQVRLTGRTGVLAETLLLGGRRSWTVRDLATAAAVSPTLAHRVVTRLEGEGFLTPHGRGREKTRILTDSQALAELWGREERPPKPFLRGFLYGATLEVVVRKILERVPRGAVGGVVAANLYKPILTQVPPPVRVWVPVGFAGDTFARDTLTSIGFEQTLAGANIEFVQAKSDPWQVHRNTDGLPKVSSWRAWLEIAKAEGRTEDLAECLRSDLEQQCIEKTAC